MKEPRNSKVLADNLLAQTETGLIIRYHLMSDSCGMPAALKVELFIRLRLEAQALFYRAHGTFHTSARDCTKDCLELEACPVHNHSDWLEAQLAEWEQGETLRGWLRDKSFAGSVMAELNVSRADPAFLIYHGRIHQWLIDATKEAAISRNQNWASMVRHHVLAGLEAKFQAFVYQLERDSFVKA